MGEDQWKSIAADFQADANRARQDATEAWAQVKELQELLQIERTKLQQLEDKLAREVAARVQAQVIVNHLTLSEKIFGTLGGGK